MAGLDWAEFLPTLLAMLAAGLFAGFAAGIFGIGGGFVVVPALYAIFTVMGGDPSVTTHVAIGTSLGTIIVTSLRSVQAHARRGAVDFEVLKTWAPWIVLGVLLGLILAKSIDGQSLTLVFAIGVFIMGLYMMFGRTGALKVADTMPTGWLRAVLATFVGSFASLMGIGGGTFAILVMTLFGKPIHSAIATAAGFGFIIAVPGAIGFAIIGQGVEGLPPGSIGYINVIGLLAITAMTALTAPAGAYVAHKMNPALLKRVFATYLLFTTGVMFFDAYQARLDQEPGAPYFAEAATLEHFDSAVSEKEYQALSGAPPEEGLSYYESARRSDGGGASE